MDFDLYRRVLEANRHIRMVELWNWGEPLAHSRITDFIGYASSQNITTSLTTNATLLTPDRSKELLRAGLSEIIFSVDALGEDYERIRQSPFDLVQSNVRAFIKEKDKASGRIRMAANIVESTWNGNAIAETRDTLLRWRLDRINVTSCNVYDGSHSSDARTVPCREWYRDMVILADGSVVPCCVDYEGHLTIGNVNNETDLVKIFNSPRARQLRRLMKNSETMPQTCRECVEFTGSFSVRKFR